MKTLTDHLQANGIPTDGLVIHGRQGMQFLQTQEHDISGHMVDIHVPRVKSLSVRRGDEVVLDVPPDTPMFHDIARTLSLTGRLPLGQELSAKPGEAVKERLTEFSVPYALVVTLRKEQDDQLEAFLDRNRGFLEEGAWTNFQRTQAFADHPCSREFFQELHAEFKASQYSTSMGVDDYHRWHQSSLGLLDGDGAMTPEALGKATRLLDVWQDKDPKDAEYWLCRNMGVHPRHRPLFAALIEERQQASAPAAGM